MTAEVRIEGLSLEVTGYQFPDAAEYWDANWLMVRARLEAPGCRLDHAGPFLRSDELARFAATLAQLDAGSADAARLDPMEPQLSLHIERRGRLGRLTVTAGLTPDPQTQAHRVTFDSDLSHLPPLCVRLRALLTRYPVRGQPDA